ncbi:unnamed protein product [Ilex paraguariensis]|uniref:O-methyltransferase C-terminal domain-containing protein n=1 Tax=Ilex paraguariensis TaxID=185542 RepID=A0ABC8RL27_9AQUA
MLDPILTEPWHYVTEWFQNEDGTTFETAHGQAFWAYAGHEPRLNHFFNDAMASDAQLVSSVVIRECKGVFEGVNSLVDVGGGTGAVGKAIADAFPDLKSTNLSYVAGDMFEAIPTADAVLLKTLFVILNFLINTIMIVNDKHWILHDWSDEESLCILKKCKDAISIENKEGKIIIIDIVLENKKGDDNYIETQLFFDMLMMVLVTGRERNEKEWAKLFYDAGFSDYKITPVLGLRSLIEVYP